MNHIGLLDTGAQMDFIHRVKCEEALTQSQGRSNSSSFSSSSTQSGSSRGHFSPRASLHPFPPFDRTKDEESSNSPPSPSNGRWSSLFFRQAPSDLPSGQGSNISKGKVVASPAIHTSTSDSSLCDQDQPRKASKARGHHHADIFRKSSSQSHIPALLEASTCQPQDPYCLRAVGHSLGGMSLLMHCTARGPAASHVHRLILLTPAGFHVKKPRIAVPISWTLPLFTRVLRCIYPKFAFPVFIPTSLFRGLVFKLFRDIHSIPALVDLLKVVIKLLLSNDASQWERVVQMPHYNANSMPTASIFQILHLVQIARSGKFQMFDYGSSKANMQAYGSAEPLDVASLYGSRLKGIPIDLVAGTKDGIISDSNVKMHRDRMEAAGLEVSYREFSYGHLDFTFAVKEELRNYILKLIRKDV